MLDPDLILAACSSNLPRYTSYPTAPHFKADGATRLSEMLIAEARASEAISIYVHIPFCDRLCWFCGCHTKQTLKYEPVKSYVGTLLREIRLAARAMGKRVPLAYLHFGGGSPSMLKASDFERLRHGLEEFCEFRAGAEISVEIDPSDRNDDLLIGLQLMGVTRCSIGVQDFSPEVQAAINRIQSVDDTRRTIEDLRSIGISSLNIDILYGLPLQTEERLRSTVDKAVALAPDRIALFGYAHVPWMKKHQSMIAKSDLPSDSERPRHAAAAAANLVAAGYVQIGFDHFAKPSDSMALAESSGRLRRNFQGYTTDACDVMFGFGASAISRFSDGFVQSIVPTAQYEAAVQEGRLPHWRGRALSLDDRIRGWMIERLMCDMALQRTSLERAFPDHAASYWDIASSAHETLPPGLTQFNEDTLLVPKEARNYVRVVASQFDAYLGKSEARYSKAI
jgi:oxygen-independent coproporphyrinogen-3 oxidase